MTLETFEDRLMALTAEGLDGGLSYDEILSALELRLMALQEEQESYE